MRIGFLTDITGDVLDWAQENGFGSIEWMRFADGVAGPQEKNWKANAENLAAQAKARDIRISAIGALYKNPLDPAQTEYARTVFHRAIDVAALIGVRNVSGFAGAVIETTLNARGGNPIYTPLENFLPQVVAFWQPIAKYAADHGVRIALEHCPQGEYHLPVMHYNLLGQTALWDKFFDAMNCANVGLEWDPAHLMCQFIDPVANIHKFGSKIFHVHAKDAFINRQLLETYGICHHGVAEHRWPGFGEANWSEIIHALLRVGYDSDLNLEGWHDPIIRDHDATATTPLAGKKLEQDGRVLAKRWLEQFVPKNY